MRDQEHADRRHHAELALTQARYEADLARRQYDAVDPALGGHPKAAISGRLKTGHFG